jgi:hypothetical protein
MIDNAQIKAVGAKETIDVRIKTQTEVPDGLAGEFGYAIQASKGNKALILATHIGVQDGIYGDLTSGFHAHVAELQQPSSECTAYDAEIDLHREVPNSGPRSKPSWSVEGVNVAIKKIPRSIFADAKPTQILSFTLVPKYDANKRHTHTCLKIIDSKAV